MNSKQLAKEFIETMAKSHREEHANNMNDSMRGESMILQYIDSHSEKVSPSDISKAVGCSTARVAAALNSLEKKGMIEREMDPADRRRILVAMTKEGKRLTKEKTEMLLTVTSQMIEYLGEKDAKEYIRILKKLSDFKVPGHK